MDMKEFKKEVKNMSYNSLEKACEDLSMISYLVYIKRTEEKFIFELKNGEIFTMDNDDVVTHNVLMSKRYNEIFFEKKLRIAADWKKTENYEVLDEREKFNFIRHEVSLEDSLNKLLKVTNRTKGRFLTQRDIVDEIAIIYGYLKRKKNSFEIYLGTDYDLCSIVELSTHRARKYYKLYHHLHERDYFASSDENDIYTIPLGKETFVSLKNIEVINNLKNLIEKQKSELEDLKNNLKDLKSNHQEIIDLKNSQNRLIDEQGEEIESFKKEILRLKNSLKQELDKKGFISKILGL